MSYIAGVGIFVDARIRLSDGHPEEHLPGGPRDLAASRRSFRFGLQFAANERAGVLSLLFIVSYLGLGMPVVAGFLAVHGPGLIGAVRYHGAALIMPAVLGLVRAERKERKRS